MKRSKLRTFVDLFKVLPDGHTEFDSRFEVNPHDPWLTSTDEAGQTMLRFPPPDSETPPVVKRLGGYRWTISYVAEPLH